MSAVIHENEIPQVVDLLQSLAALDDKTLPADLEPDEIALLAQHRRQKLLRLLQNKGITVRAAPTATPEIPV